MLKESDLRELLDVSAPGAVVSLYLNTEPSEGNADAYKLRLRSLLKRVYSPQDVSAIENYFNHQYDWTGRSVAVFSSAARGFFKAFPLAVPVPSLAQLGDRPVVKPLAGLLDNFGGYGVVLVDKQGARLFFFHLGELREQEGVMGEAVKHTKRGGASTFPGRRGGTAGQTHYEDELVERNMKESAEFAAHFFEENHVRRVLIGGTDDNVSQFRAHLSKAWQSLVMGAFPMSMTASHTEVLNKAMQIGREAEQRREAQMVERVVTAAAKLSGAVIGLEDTLQAVNDHKVQTLVILEGFRQVGYVCRGCGILTTQPLKVCAGCGEPVEKIADVVELAVQGVMRGGGEVEVLQNSSALEKVGSIGAVLRY